VASNLPDFRAASTHRMQLAALHRIDSVAILSHNGQSETEVSVHPHSILARQSRAFPAVASERRSIAACSLVPKGPLAIAFDARADKAPTPRYLEEIVDDLLGGTSYLRDASVLRHSIEYDPCGVCELISGSAFYHPFA
jgi:hypothetical protein